MPAATDDFATYKAGLADPAEHLEAVTPHDTNDLAKVSRWLYVGTGGSNLTVITAAGETVTFGNVVSGALLPVRVSRVKSTGTGCSNIVAGA